MKEFKDKQVGRCLACQTDCHEVLEVHADGHPLAGHPKRLGGQLEIGTQVRFLLSTGATADVTFCDDCARALEPDDYWPVWRACVARQDLALQLAGRTEAVRRHAMATSLAEFPLARLARRQVSPDGLMTLDRR